MVLALLLAACSVPHDELVVPRDSAPGHTAADTDTAPEDTGIDDPDADGDGSPASEDCDDADPNVRPGAEEACDDTDNDCDGLVDEVGETRWYRDADEDGYGDPAVEVHDCATPAGYVADATDCDDNEARIHPSAPDDTEDGFDNDCDGEADEDYDACGTPRGVAAWWAERLAVSNADREMYGLVIFGDAVVCDVSCEPEWIELLGVGAGCDGEYRPLPIDSSSGRVDGCIRVSPPSSGARDGTCTARTSAGTITLGVVWDE